MHWRIPPVFSWLQKEGVLSEEEMSRTFNCGLGAVLVVSKQDAQRVLRQVQAQEEAWIVGSITCKLLGELTMDEKWQFDIQKKLKIHTSFGYGLQSV